MKKLLSIFITLSLLLSISPIDVFATGNGIIRNDNSGIPDKALYKAILNELGKKSGTFTKKEAESIKYFYLNIHYTTRGDIKSLKGIGNLKELIGLGVSYNKLTSLSGIEKLTKLESLSVDNNNLNNLKGIENLKELLELDVSYNKLASLNEIEKLTKLKELMADDNNLKNLKGIGELKKLESLSVSNNKLKNLKGIEGLKELRSLYVHSNDLTSISEVEGLTQLEWLYVGYNKLTNIKEVKKLIKLQGLSASGNKIKKLPDLSEHKHLHYENTWLVLNQLSKKELIDKMPDHLGIGWIEGNARLQNLTRTIKPKTPGSFRKITVNTKEIIGVADKKLEVRLMAGRKTIDTEVTNRDGVFRFRYLDLKRYAGQELKLQVFSESFKYSYGDIIVKSISFTVREKELKLKKPSSFSKIKTTTKRLTGTADKNVSVRLVSGNKTIKTVKTNSMGDFNLENLNLRRYGGKKLKLQAYDNVNRKKWIIKSVAFTVKKV